VFKFCVTVCTFINIKFISDHSHWQTSILMNESPNTVDVCASSHRRGVQNAVHLPPFLNIQTSSMFIGFEVLTAVVMKSSVVRDITLSSLLEDNRYFGRTCRLHLHGQRISQARTQLNACFTLVSGLAYSSTLKMEATFSSETSGHLEWTTQ
jgi:hypothetical protein